ncbi:unnamed protein product [Linum tenue]|uniref:Uncharacterized protein n=1 Tax=Linum tenue TaxID=586396 RepID=A0AAV0HGP5_9ROSI|nr:unnamed protein product [Linum tenue]
MRRGSRPLSPHVSSPIPSSFSCCRIRVLVEFRPCAIPNDFWTETIVSRHQIESTETLIVTNSPASEANRFDVFIFEGYPERISQRTICIPLSGFKTYLRFPWRPLISIVGATVYELNEDFKIVRHTESWNVSALEAVGQIFTPSFDRRPGEQ